VGQAVRGLNRKRRQHSNHNLLVQARKLPRRVHHTEAGKSADLQSSKTQSSHVPYYRLYFI
jgi:hypothetical protein